MPENDWLDDPNDDPNDPPVDPPADPPAEEPPELDEKAQAYVNAQIQKREQDLMQRVAQAAMAKGLTFSADGGFGIGAADRFVAEFGLGGIQANAPPPERERQQPQDDPEDVMPEFYDQQQLAQWLAKRDDRLVKKVVESMQPEIAKMHTALQARDMAGDAVERAKVTLREFGMEHIADHPGFDRTYREALLGTDPATWSSPQNIMGYAGYIAPLLKQQGGLDRKPAQQRNRDDEGRYSREERGRVLDQVGSDRGGGRPAAQRGRAALSDTEKQFAGFFGLEDQEDIEAAGDEFGRARREVQAAKRAKAAGGR